MITETLQAVILSTYCAFVFLAIAHAITCGILFVCTPLESLNQLPSPSLQSSVLLSLQSASNYSVSTIVPCETENEDLLINEQPTTTGIQAHLGIRELKALASKHKIRGYGKMSKAQLIEVLFSR